MALTMANPGSKFPLLLVAINCCKKPIHKWLLSMNPHLLKRPLLESHRYTLFGPPIEGYPTKKPTREETNPSWLKKDTCVTCSCKGTCAVCFHPLKIVVGPGGSINSQIPHEHKTIMSASIQPLKVTWVPRRGFAILGRMISRMSLD